jgi:hypothetical protein
MTAAFVPRPIRDCRVIRQTRDEGKHPLMMALKNFLALKQ